MAPHFPDILWVVTTQWRAQATGYAGDPNARTPSLDALAACSVNYTQAITPHPFGPFARAAMLTGQLSPENGVREYFDPLPTTSRTIAHLLADRGYETAFFGKWHLWKRDPVVPLVGEAHAKIIIPPAARGGFRLWEGFESGFQLNDPWLHGTRLAEPVQVAGYQPDVLCQRAAEWFKKSNKRAADRATSRAGLSPQFCIVSLETPHPPYAAPAAGLKPLDPSKVCLSANVPRGGEIEAQARQELAGYYSHIEATDRAIGRLLEAVSEETLVVFTSVHGDMHGAHGLFRKGWPYEESVRVPLLVRVPGGRAEIRSDAVSLVDLAWLTGAFLDQGAWPKIEAEYAMLSMPSVVGLPHQCDRAWQGRRSKSRKQIFNADGSAWLDFDLDNDPAERTNLV